MEHAAKVKAALEAAGVRVKLDLRDDVSPGYKFNDWEMRGVPVRVEIGPRDVEGDAVVLGRRDIPGKDGKQFGIPAAQVGDAVRNLLVEIQAGLLRQATEFRDANTRSVSTYDEFRQLIDGDGGFIRVHWAGSDEDEDTNKEETKATIRVFPEGADDGEGVCFYTGKKTSQVAIFARAY
jgi:prolyl-tRNA synthetase